MRLTILICSLLLASVSYAQLPINFGPKVGANYSVLRTNLDHFDKESAANFMGGAFVRVKVKKLSFNAEALFTGVKASTSGKFDENAPEENIDINYTNLDIPVLVGYKFLDLKLVKLRANAGIVQSFIQGETGDLSKDIMEDGYTSVVVGASVDIPLFVFDVRYRVGINEIYKSDAIDINSDLLVFTVGWKIL